MQTTAKLSVLPITDGRQQSSAYSKPIISDNKLVIGSLPYKTKISGSEAFRELVKMLNVSGAIAVADALRCRTKSAETAISEGGDYLYNTSVLKENIELFVQNGELEKYARIKKR